MVRRLELSDIEGIDISHGSLVSIMNDHLELRKLSARWVRCLLTNDQEHNRVPVLKEYSALFNSNPDTFGEVL